MAGHCCDNVDVLVDEEVVVAVVGEIVDEFYEHVLGRRAWLELLLVVLVVLCQPVMPNMGSVVGMERIRGAVTVPEWGWPPWCGPGVAGARCWLSFG